MAFGDHLQEVRKRNSLTQEEFAEQLQVSRQAVSKWESGRGYPELDKVIYICSRYGTTMDELFADELPPREAGAAQQPKTLPHHTLHTRQTNPELVLQEFSDGTNTTVAQMVDIVCCTDAVHKI